MPGDDRFRRLMRGGALLLLLVVAGEVVIIAARPAGLLAYPAALGGAGLALAILLALLFALLWRRRVRRRIQGILAGDYLVRWRYTRGEWSRFVLRERALTIRLAFIFLPLTLAFVALLVLLRQATDAPLRSLLDGSIAFFLLAAVAFLGGLLYAFAGRRAYLRRAQLAGDTYVSRAGILYPDRYRSLRALGAHVAAVAVMPGTPTQLRITLRLGRTGRLLALLGTAPTQWDVWVPVPVGHEAEAATVAAQLLAR
ncbi:MAG TPA: hypothetical protein VGR57_09040 [Ktedonobacterales bacterium]|nr:hypothetical protein [Ktedonobacterales bacterium]